MILRWTGSDTLYLISYPPGIRFRFRIKIFFFRIFIRFAEWFIQSHTVFCELMKEHLVEFGCKKKIEIVPVILKYDKKLEKIKHNGFNILYYFPKGKKNPKFMKWLYGWDIYLSVKNLLGDKVNWILIDGSYDMKKIFPIIDFYLRPNRHDGYGRLRAECEVQDIPYYWSREKPDIIKIIKQIRRLT